MGPTTSKTSVPFLPKFTTFVPTYYEYHTGLTNMKHSEPQKKKKSLDGITLEMMLIDLSTYVGWEKMAEKVSINCFKSRPSIKSSLAFLRRTPWARDKVEVLYRYSMHKIEFAKSNPEMPIQEVAEKKILTKPKSSHTGIFPKDHFIQNKSAED